MKNLRYLEAVKNLTNAINIAIEVFQKYPPKELDDVQLNHIINVYSNWGKEVISPEPKYDNLASLKYSIEAVFTYFQEGSGVTVEEFWVRIKEAQLPYQRVNKLTKILKRKKIKNDIEYDFIIDVLVPYQQENLISDNDVILLNQMIKEFENRKVKL